MTVRPGNRLADSPMVHVACRRCSANVLARKSTWEQTSVQWDALSTARCEQRADARALSALGGRGIFLGCSELTESILGAVSTGELTLVDEQ